MTRIRGIDFTSRPGRMKPITVAGGELDGGVLRIGEMRYLASFAEFDAALGESGPWVAGIDFPFGQPRKLIEDLKWPRESWTDLIEHVRKMGKEGFECAIKDYTKGRSKGDKENKRATDPSYAISAMHLNNPPAGKMFFAGAPRIEASGASIVPCAPNGNDRVIVEAYAAMVVKTLREGSYKGPMPDSRDARRQIVEGLSGPLCRERYGLTVQMDKEHRLQLIYDPTGDPLDAVLCALQAAWASQQPDLDWMDKVRLEGCIADPNSQRLLDLKDAG